MRLRAAAWSARWLRGLSIYILKANLALAVGFDIAMVLRVPLPGKSRPSPNMRVCLNCGYVFRAQRRSRQNLCSVCWREITDLARTLKHGDEVRLCLGEDGALRAS